MSVSSDGVNNQNGDHVSFGAEADWQQFLTPETDTDYFTAWLRLCCTGVDGAGQAILLMREEASDRLTPIALWPDDNSPVDMLRPVAEAALGQGALVEQGGQQTADQQQNETTPWQLGFPIALEDGTIMALVAMAVSVRDEAHKQAVKRHLMWASGWLEAQLWRDQASHAQARVGRAAFALDLVALAEDHHRLEAAGMAVVDLMRVKLGAARVSIGLYDKGRGATKMIAASDTSWFDPRTLPVQLCQRAMDEAIDQAATIIFPLPADAVDRHILVAHQTYAAKSDCDTIMTVTLFNKGQPMGALVIEWAEAPQDTNQASNQGERDDVRGQASIPAVERRSAAEAAAALLGPVFAEKARQKIWITGRAADLVSEGAAALFGDTKPIVKTIAVSVVLIVLMLGIARTDFRVGGDAVVEGAVQRAAVAPFDGFLASGPKRAGDLVRAGDVLATLDDRDLRLEVQTAAAEVAKFDSQRQKANAESNRVEAGLLLAQMQQAQAQLALAEQKLARINITAPLDGVVLTGDVSQQLGSPVSKGEVLFEIAPLDDYRLVLQVPETDIAFVHEGLDGTVVLSGLAGTAIPIKVTRVTSVAAVVDGDNSYRVEAMMAPTDITPRPGMEGIGKITVGSRSYLYVWTRGLINWLRVFFWTWLP